MTTTGTDPATRAAIRAFARTHHPDVGGDPAVFAAGLAELRSGRPHPAPNRFDAPVVAVEDRSRLRRAMIRALRRARGRPVPHPRGGFLR